mmetsp:Transcript_116129/g.182704  ORF Transcript_116129/g.182704 Transcript_116129/m.182704 type:complete len:90 (+) Transcript_116129:405-674(+)
MNTWSKDQGAEGKLKFLADQRMELTTALGLVFEPKEVSPTGHALGTSRCKRFALLVDNLIVKEVFVQQEHNGVQGVKEDTFGEKMLSML